MKLFVAEREAFRESVKKLLPHLEKSNIVKHFSKERIASRTIYDTIKRLQTAQPIKDDK